MVFFLFFFFLNVDLLDLVISYIILFCALRIVNNELTYYVNFFILLKIKIDNTMISCDNQTL